MRARLGAVDADRRHTLSAEICRHLGELIARRGSERVAWYAPLPDEVDTDPVLEGRWRRGEPVWLPRMRGDGSLDFVQVSGPADLHAARHGLREPLPTLPATSLGRLDAVVVPGLAFDRVGLRLGRGGGYYDRTFSAARRGPRAGPITIGVAFSFQILDRLPRAQHDLRVDALVTEHGPNNPR